MSNRTAWVVSLLCGALLLFAVFNGCGSKDCCSNCKTATECDCTDEDSCTCQDGECECENCPDDEKKAEYSTLSKSGPPEIPTPTN